jgi:serine/threonine-protein kinase
MSQATPAAAATDTAGPQPRDSISWRLTLLLDEQSVDWQRGARTPVETYLDRTAGLGGDAEVVLNLVYHEVLLRRRLGGLAPTLAEYVARFPHLEEALEIQFALDQALPDEPTVPAEPRIEPLPPSARVPGYDIEAVLGRGGMGVVYRARHLALNRTVALKMILDGVHASPRQSGRFRTEAELVARLQHPNIVQIHEIGEHDGRPFLALEHVSGGSLDRALAGTPWPAPRAAALVSTLARAVDHAHARGVVHRDLKPANVLLTAEREPKIIDFGLAKLVAGASHQSESGALVGTPSYMAPEQVEGQHAAIGPSTDIYALGAILYEALTGRPPFRAESPMATMLQVRACDVVPPRQLSPSLPRDLETICLKSLAKDPRRRYGSAAAVADDLERYLQGRPILARPVPAWERLWLWTRRQRTLAAGLACGALALVVLVLGGIVHNVQLRRLNNQLEASNSALDGARSSAELNARDAMAAITQLLVRVADERLAGIPEAESVRRDLLNDAINKLEPLQARRPTDPEIRQEIGRAHLGIAAIHKVLGEFAQAESQARTALAALDPLLEEYPGDDRVADTMAGAHVFLAELLSPEQGKDHFVRAVALWEPLAGKDPAVRGKLAASYFSVAFQKKGFGLAPAIDYCRQAIAMLEGLARDDPGTYNHDLARATYNLGLAEATTGQTTAAIEQYRRCLRLWAALPPDRRNDGDDEGVAACQNALGMLLQTLQTKAARSEAETILRQAVGTRRQLMNRHPRRLAHRAALARAFSNLGSFFWGEQRFAEAEVTYLEALRANEENVRDFPESSSLRVLLAHGHHNLADTRAKLNQHQEARQGFEKALKLADSLVQQSPHEFEVLQCLGTVCLNYANLMNTLSGPSAALPLQERCVRAFEEVHELAPYDAEMRTFLKGSRGNLRDTLTVLKRYDEALVQVDAALPLCNDTERQAWRLVRSLILVHAGRYEPATAEAQSIAASAGLDAESLYNLACIFSLAVAAVRADAQLVPTRKVELLQNHSRSAIRLIDRSYREGHFPRDKLLELLAQDADMQPIRDSAEFKDMIETLKR